MSDKQISTDTEAVSNRPCAEIRYEKVFFRTRFYSDGDSDTSWSDEHGNRIPAPREIYRRVEYDPNPSIMT